MTFTMMCGLPGSGKSTYAKELEDTNTALLSSDRIRGEIFGDETDQCHNKEIFEEMFNRTINNLNAGKNVVYDATNIDRMNRMNTLKNIKYSLGDAGSVEFKIIIVVRAFDDCVVADAERERTVGEKVISRMRTRYNPPARFEGWDSIEYKYIPGSDPYKHYRGLDNFDLENSRYNISLGEHLKLTEKEAIDNFYSRNVIAAAAMHDIGKVWTKRFVTYDNRPSIDALYYKHQLVGAYECLPILLSKGTEDFDITEVSNLIADHMIGTSKKSQEILNQIKDYHGDVYYNNLLRLINCDRHNRIVNNK